MSNEKANLDHIEQSCISRGIKLTSTRKLILNALSNANKALSAYEIADYCKTHFSSSIQPMSVYRILDFLESEHCVHKLKLANKFIICSHILCDHQHGYPQFLICSKCHKVNELVIDASVMAGIQTQAVQKGFTLTDPQFEISCVCHNCEHIE